MRYSTRLTALVEELCFFVSFLNLLEDLSLGWIEVHFYDVKIEDIFK